MYTRVNPEVYSVYTGLVSGTSIILEGEGRKEARKDASGGVVSSRRGGA